MTVTTIFIDMGKIGFAFWPKLKLLSRYDIIISEGGKGGCLYVPHVTSGHRFYWLQIPNYNMLV